jgi:hypothetical protein
MDVHGTRKNIEGTDFRGVNLGFLHRKDRSKTNSRILNFIAK